MNFGPLRCRSNRERGTEGVDETEKGDLVARLGQLLRHFKSDDAPTRVAAENIRRSRLHRLHLPDVVTGQLLHPIEELLAVLGSGRLEPVEGVTFAHENREVSEVVERSSHAGHAEKRRQITLALHRYEGAPSLLRLPETLGLPALTVDERDVAHSAILGRDGDFGGQRGRQKPQLLADDRGALGDGGSLE